MNGNIKNILVCIVIFFVFTVYTIMAVDAFMGEFITFRLHKEQYTIQKAKIIESNYAVHSRYGRGLATIVYVVDDKEIEARVELNLWENKGDEIEIAVDKNGDYIRTDIIFTKYLLVVPLCIIIDMLCIYIIIRSIKLSNYS